MQTSDSPVSSPEVDCYEECVVAEEEVLASSADLESSTDKDSPIPKVKKASGRVTKKCRSRSTTGKKSSSQIILRWLEDNYETVPGACLPRSVLYTHYQDFCKRNHLEPSAAASFGKIIRVKFPNLSTRRLGTRGQSKYHYYGLAIRETSIYYRSIYSKQGLTRFSGASLKKENSQLYNPTSKTGILLPDFPAVNQLNFSKSFPVEKVETFLLMYRAHCQRILDSVVRANFHEVQDFLVHFWQGMPQHMLPILNSQETVDLVVICDFILYHRLCEVLIPANLQQLPENLIEDILSFSHKLTEWMFAALHDLPAPLGIKKVQLAEMFGKSLRRQTALVQLAKDARGVLRSSESVSCILNDWRAIDFETASSQVLFSQQLPEHSLELFKEFACELEQLLVKQSSLEVYFEWLDSLIERKVCEPASRADSSLQELSQEFLIAWNSFYIVVEKEILFLKGKSFDLYRIVHVALNEYIHHVMELLQMKVVEAQFNGSLLSSTASDKRPTSLPCLPKVEDARGTSNSSCGLPPIFPPTPTSANSDNREFLHYFENRITPEYHDPLAMCSTLPSPGYPLMSDSAYESFFKQEMLFHQACMGSSMPMVDGVVNPHHFEATPPPLTPQSSFCSSNSPLSHTSVCSPGSAAMTPDQETARPLSQQGHLYNNLDSPQQGDVAHTPMLTYPENGSACTSPLQHPSVPGGLDIAASLDLAEACCSPNFMHHGNFGNMMAATSPLYPTGSATSASMGGRAYPSSMAATSPYQPMTPPTLLPDGFFPSHPHAMNYSQYDFELHQLMSDPSELLTKAISDPKDTKPSIAHLAMQQAHTPPAAIM